MDCSEPAYKPVVIVTGASRGLGRHVALAFGRSGFRVLVNYAASEDKAAEVVNEIMRAGGEATSRKADVRSEQDVDSLVRDVAQRWGSVDVVVNNAGVNRDGLHLRMHERDWDDVIRTNLTGPFHCIRSASRVMMKQRSGQIINIASITGIQGREGQANYSASKAGLIGLTKATARELGRFGIRVNCVLPGFLATDMVHTVSAEIRDKVLREHCLPHASDPDEVASFICHLSGMKNVSGQVFNLDSRIL